MTQPGEVVEDLPLVSIPGGGKLVPFLQQADLRKGQRVSFDGRGGMHIAAPAVLLQGRNPGKINHSALNPLTQHRHLFDFGKQARSDDELGDVGHKKW